MEADASAAKDAKRLGKAADTVTNLYFFVGTTVALVILISGDLFSNPAAAARANLDASFGAWCQQWTQQCNPLLVYPQGLVCSLFDETYASAVSNGGGSPGGAWTYVTLADVGVNATPTAMSGTYYVPGAVLLRKIYTCPLSGNIDLASVATCTFQTSAVAALTTFTNETGALSAATVNDCQLQVTWLINAAGTFAILFDVCNFPVASGIIYLSASIVLLSITTMYVLQVHIHRLHDSTSIGSVRRLLIYELVFTPFLLIIGVTALYQGAGHAACFNTFQLIGFLAFAIFIVTAALALFAVNGVLLRSANQLRRGVRVQSTYYSADGAIELTSGKRNSSDWQSGDLGSRT